MKRGESSGGGQSSLGYLFGSPNDQPNPNKPPPPPSILEPPYGTDALEDSRNPKSPLPPSPNPNQGGSDSNNPKVQRGNSLGNFIMGKPTTKVKSVPGGSSSLGYLFGDKK